LSFVWYMRLRFCAQRRHCYKSPTDTKLLEETFQGPDNSLDMNFIACLWVYVEV